MERGRLVLVVDDEYLQRIAAVGAIEETELDVIDAGSATEAVRLLQTRPAIGIVLADAELLVSARGQELASVLSARSPEVRTVIGSRKRSPPLELPRGALVLRKPYQAENVRRVLEEAACPSP